jgi:hypothetical protein
MLKSAKPAKKKKQKPLNKSWSWRGTKPSHIGTYSF